LPELAVEAGGDAPLMVLEMSRAALRPEGGGTELERTARRLGMHPKGLETRLAFEKYRR